MDILGSPGLLDGPLQHKWMGGTLSETEKLNHEDTIIAAGFASLEKGVEVVSEAILGLYGSQYCSKYLKDIGMTINCQK